MTTLDELLGRLRELARVRNLNATLPDITADSMIQAADALEAAARENERLREALEGVMIGGNHLALLIGADHPPYTAEPAAALEHYGAGDAYEIWCCWRSIMLARNALSGGPHE